MAQNLFLRFAFQGANLNLLTDAQYQVDNMRYVGNERGIARRQLVNKTLKQGASMAYALGEAVVFASGLDIADDGDGLNNLIEYLKKVFLPPYIEADANKFLRINSTGTGIVFTTIEYATPIIAGLIRQSTQAQVDAAVDDLTSVTPATLRKGLSNGVAPLGANTKVPSQYLPSVDDGVAGLVGPANINEVNAATINNKYVSPATLLKGKANGVCTLDAAIKVPISSLYYNVANGIAPTDSNNLIPQANLPIASISTRGIINIATEQEVVAGTEPNKAITPYLLMKGKANGVCPLGSDSKFLIGYHPNSGVSAGTYARVSVNATGHVTSGDNNLNAGWLTSGTFSIARHPASGVPAGTYSRVTVNSTGHVTGYGYVPTQYQLQLPSAIVPLWSGVYSVYNYYLPFTNRVAGQGLTVGWNFTFYNGEVNTTIYCYIGSSSGGTDLLVGSISLGRKWNGYTADYSISNTVYPSWSGGTYFYVRTSSSDWDSTGRDSRFTIASTVNFTYVS